jgi:hypothetical protein
MMLLELSVMLPNDIYSTGISDDDHHSKRHLHSHIFMVQIMVSLIANSRVINNAPRVVNYAPK